MADTHNPPRRGAGSRKLKKNLFEIHNSGTLIKEIAARHRITSPWFEAALAIILAWDAPRVRRLRPTDTPKNLKSNALQTYRALSHIDKLSREIGAQIAPVEVDGTESPVGTFPPIASSYSAWEWMKAAERLGVTLSPAPMNWLDTRWPRVAPELLALAKARAELPELDRRKIPKRDLQEQILVQLLAVIVKVAGGHVYAMSGEERGPSFFQEACYAVASHLDRRWEKSPRLMVEANKGALGPEKAFYERVAEMLKDEVIKAQINQCVTLMKKSPQRPEDAGMDIGNFEFLLMGPPKPDPGQ